MWLCMLTGRWIEDTFENTQWRKAKQVQTMWICILTSRPFEETFENARRKKSNKCYQCDLASYQTGDLRRHLKMYYKKLNKLSCAVSETFHPLTQIIWQSTPNGMFNLKDNTMNQNLMKYKIKTITPDFKKIVKWFLLWAPENGK